MRQVGCILEDQDPRFFKYGEANDKLYTIPVLLHRPLLLTSYIKHMEDFTFMDPFGTQIQPITRDSVWVQAFNIWTDEEVEESASPSARAQRENRQPRLEQA